MRPLVSILVLFLAHVARASNYCEDLRQRYNITQRLQVLAPQDERVFRADMDEIYNRIGPGRVGWIDLAQIRSELRSLRICVNPDATPLTGSGTRHGSVYFTKERIIVINRDRALANQHTPEYSLLLIHEVLGALGYPDENYMVSSLVYAKAQTPELGAQNVSLLQHVVGEIVDKSENDRRTETMTTAINTGGISGVGGGGDPEAALIKPFAIFTLLAEDYEYFQEVCGGPESKEAALRNLIEMRIEPDDAVEFSRFKTPFPGLYLANDQGKQFIQISSGLWAALRKDTKLRDARTLFIHNVVSLSCLIKKARHE